MEALIVYGLSIGALLFILSVGLTLIFGMLDVINFAHGSFYMLGAYLGYSIMRVVGNFWVSLIIAPLAAGIIGAGVELLTLRHLYRRSPLYQLLLTFGLTLIFDDLIKFFWGSYQLPFEIPKILFGCISLFGIQIPVYRVFVILVVSIFFIALLIVLEKTRVGILIRASASNKNMTQCMGIDVKKVFTATFGIGTMLAGFSGMVGALMAPVTPGMGAMIIIDCFLVVILGGLGSMKGTLFGALLIGEAQAFGSYYLPDYSAFPIYILIAVVLLVRPEGLFGELRIHI
jgi:branched-chain amino acid transport system permease protein